MNEYSFSVSLRLWHPERLSREITSILQVEPRHSGDVGSTRMTPKGTQLAGVYDQTFWTARIVDGSSAGRSLAAAVSEILDRFEVQQDFFRDFSSTGGRAELFIGWFLDNGNSGDVLEHRLLRRLADLGLDLSFDIYPDMQD
jgi:hypothetical protein